ncbi:hypothetical protein [Microbacterium sp. CIAB417]|uniref:DUF7927 domain-containing protein n=1 Tax=Microbacterium sp. CIAB417 TaxID=2860287 RepID=UPI001FAD26B5|nr:hypothetical protein [Microbacterium sp. CIAB417]
MAVLLAGAVGIGGSIVAASPAYAAPIHEITGEWLSPPAEMKSGDPVVADWRVNVNDDAQPPTNEPVENVIATFLITNGEFAEIPDICLTEGVDPVSAVSEDGLVLTCNLGTVDMGTAVAVQTPVLADGPTGSELTLGGEIDGQAVDLDPIPIVNPFLMDVDVTNPPARALWDEDRTTITMDFPWTVYLGRNSDQGPADVTYPLRMTSSTGSPISIGTSFDTTTPGGGCLPRHSGNGSHPLTVGATADEDRLAPFVGSCELVEVDAAAGRWDLVLTGLDYSLEQVPTLSGDGRALPVDRNAIATGTLWFQVDTVEAGSLRIDVLPVTYTAPGGQTIADDVANNTTDKAYTRAGSWTAAWNRTYTDSGGTSWDDSYRVAPGTLVNQLVNNNHRTWAPPGSTLPFGNCLALDTRWVSFESADVRNVADPSALPIEYYTGDSPLLDPENDAYDPDVFDCGTASGWSTSAPADLSEVRAVRVIYPFTEYASTPNLNAPIQLFAFTRISEDAQPGQDIWMFGSVLRGQGEWVGPDGGNSLTPTPDARYPDTNGRRDILRIATVFPAIEKDVERATVVAGVPVEYTLTYSGNGTGMVPESVDDYVIEDRLPAGMSYVPGSGDPEPQSVELVDGQYVLRWVLDGVETNTEHELTYEAVADSSIAPGQQLTNTAVAEYGPSASQPADATVTTSSNGYTTILKTSDVDYIRNDAGDGVGTGSWTVEIESHDPFDQDFTDTIDILPYNGDGRGTSYSGSYSLDEVVAPDDATVYYTDADPETLSFDPADASNGAAGAPDGNTVGWTTTKPENPTAVRVIGGTLEPGGSFSFQVVITTDGAQPRDTYVNSAQARAEHTTLVMRTSAYLAITDYTVEKTSNPRGETVVPGQVVEYEVTVTQQGEVPAGAVFSDDLSDVLDDATYNGDVSASIGTATITGDRLAWEGEIPVGGTATITYSVTVKSTDLIEAEGDWILQNVVSSPGCQSEGDCRPPHNPVGDFRFSKTSDPASGSDVVIGDVVDYHVQVTHIGEAAVPGASLVDDLTQVLDDAEWNDDAAASAGEVEYADGELTWTGDLAVGQVVDITYSVTVTGYGDWLLSNLVTDGCAEGDDDCVPPPPPGRCVPAPDENPDCRTEHRIGGYEISKSSDPVTGSEVQTGDTVAYTVTVTHVGEASVPASFTDDLSDVLDDAIWNDDLAASAGEAAFEGSELAWSGDLGVGDVATVTYSVTVVPEGDLTLRNVVAPPPGIRCVPTEGQDEACTTEHLKGRFEFSKTSDPAPGSEVHEGDIVTYTVTVAQVGPAAVASASVVDDISAVLPVASWNDDAKASSGTVTRIGDEVRWTGDLAVEQVVTITYSVTVGDEQDAEFRNVVTSDDPRGTCVDAADGNPDCETAHRTPGPGLAGTGLELSPWVLASATVLLGGGLLVLLSSRRRRIVAQIEDHDDLS